MLSSNEKYAQQTGFIIISADVGFIIAVKIEIEVAVAKRGGATLDKS